MQIKLDTTSNNLSSTRIQTKSNFRELKPEDWWSGFVSVKNVNKEDLIKKLGQITNELKFNFSGWIVTKEDNSFDYFFTRYPRKKRGPVSPITECKSALKKLATETSGTSHEEIISDLPQFRVLLGLREFYEESNKLHTIEEVQNELGNNFNLTKAEICSVGPWGKYTEPAVVIQGDLAQIEKVYLLAEKFNQARFAVEDLYNGKSHMVEPACCKDPDKE